jgi:hypothetical protein
MPAGSAPGVAATPWPYHPPPKGTRDPPVIALTTPDSERGNEPGGDAPFSLDTSKLDAAIADLSARGVVGDVMGNRSHFTIGQDGWEEVADYALNRAAEHAAAPAPTST